MPYSVSFKFAVVDLNLTLAVCCFHCQHHVKKRISDQRCNACLSLLSLYPRIRTGNNIFLVCGESMRRIDHSKQWIK